jgi:hypothetical protein
MSSEDKKPPVDGGKISEEAKEHKSSTQDSDTIEEIKEP